MTSIDYAECLLKLYPNLKFSMKNNDLNTLDIEDDITVPTAQEFIDIQNTINNEKPLNHLRNYRNYVLSITDKYSLPDYPHENDEIKNKWIIFRQQLRDITLNNNPSLDEFNNIINVNWPEFPNGDSYP